MTIHALTVAAMFSSSQNEKWHSHALSLPLHSLRKNTGPPGEKLFHGQVILNPKCSNSRLKQKEEEELLRCDDIRQRSPELSSSCFESGNLQSSRRHRRALNPKAIAVSVSSLFQQRRDTYILCFRRRKQTGPSLSSLQQQSGTYATADCCATGITCEVYIMPNTLHKVTNLSMASHRPLRRSASPSSHGEPGRRCWSYRISSRDIGPTTDTAIEPFRYDDANKELGRCTQFCGVKNGWKT